MKSKRFSHVFPCQKCEKERKTEVFRSLCMRYWELAADVVDVDVAQAGGGGVSHLGVVVDGDVAVEDLLEEVFIVGNGEVLHGPGKHSLNIFAKHKPEAAARNCLHSTKK